MTQEEIEQIVETYLAAKKSEEIPFYKDWRFLMGVPTFLVACASAWVYFGFPTVATSADIRRIERSQAELAITTWQNIVNNLVANTPPDSAPPNQREAWREQYEQAKRARDHAVEQKIDLSK
jgi:hypothetical protein